MLTARHPDGSKRHFNVLGVVDSGAARSLFPMVVADQLGIRDSLTPNEKRSLGVGSTFDTWSARDPLGAQILGTYPEPLGRQLIGPSFELRPYFGPAPAFLLGRADFFRGFQVTFNEDAVAPRFHLDW